MSVAMPDTPTTPAAGAERCGRPDAARPDGVCRRPVRRDVIALGEEGAAPARCSRHGVIRPTEVLEGDPVDPSRGGRPAIGGRRYTLNVGTTADAAIAARAQLEDVDELEALRRYALEGMGLRKNRRPRR